jgi:hypothetical protein
LLNQCLSRRSWRDSARGSVEQPDSQPFLQRPQGMTQRGWRQVQTGRGTPKAFLFRYGNERRQFRKFIRSHD